MTPGKSIVQSGQKKYLESMFLGASEVTEPSLKKSTFNTTMNLSYQLILTISQSQTTQLLHQNDQNNFIVPL